MIIGVLKEPSPETRVSLLPEHITTLGKWKVEVIIESSAGVTAFISDQQYIDAGAKMLPRDEIIRSADLLLSINIFSKDDILLAKPGSVILGNYQALYNPGLMQEWAIRKLTVFSIDMIPRTTRAQSMDVLSSQANISGYKAVLLAANLFPRYFPMFMTAAGSIPPAKVLILGAGVAGLQSIATARRLGAVVEVFDTRAAVKEEVMSLGAKFVEVEGAADASKAGGYAVEQSLDFLARQKQKIAESVAKADIIITTAQIPGKKAPVLITTEMIDKMKSGSVIIDLAASSGGNTELTVDETTVVHNGVSIIGNSRLPSSMPYDASKLYGKNIMNFLQLMIDKEGQLNVNFSDDLVKGTCITHNGEVVNSRIADSVITVGESNAIA